jgi:OOP family OmpA-OmpF porin
VILRLKKVDFPVGKSTLPKSKVNDEIMAKVEAAIEVFPDAQLTIEGHTDSKGRMATNKKLSEKRAEAIRNYLIAHEVVTADEILYVGKGAKEPIESNSTAAGRATNRRIDIVIEPVRVLAE